MNFFEQQDRAHRNTKYLILLLCIAVISLISITTLLVATTLYFNSPLTDQLTVWQGIKHSISVRLFLSISLGVCAIIVLGSFYKFLQFSSGGRAVAEAMNGRLINVDARDDDERKVLNIVEEMAIASGTPVPPVYIIDDAAINAFAAGYTPQDAVIGVTRGCIQLLNRDELQGVIAHEFSHIFHGDMKLNMHLVALLNGILLLGLAGEFLVRSNNNRFSLATNRNKNLFALTGLGIGLIVIGYTGTFFGNLIKSAVSRQREFLADSSAVKFTRNPEGIAGALKKIGGYSGGSQVAIHNAAEFSHMYFSCAVDDSFLQLLATHPPLDERIKRIEPYWNGEYPIIESNLYKQHTYIAQQGLVARDLPPIEFAFNTDQIFRSIAQPTSAHLDIAQHTIKSIDDVLRASAHNPWDAQALMFALLLGNSTQQQKQEWQLLGNLFTANEITLLQKSAIAATSIDASLRLPLLELSLPALKQLSPQQYQRFKQALKTLIHADGQVNLSEWSLYRILINNLEPQLSPKRLLKLSQLHSEILVLMSAVAYAGNASYEAAMEAFISGKNIINDALASLLPADMCTLAHLNSAILRLKQLTPLQKPRLLKALSQCMMHDGKITIAEGELFRAIADSLDCPIPPFSKQDN